MRDREKWVRKLHKERLSRCLEQKIFYFVGQCIIAVLTANIMKTIILILIFCVYIYTYSHIKLKLQSKLIN